MWVYVLFVTVSFLVPDDNVLHSMSKALAVFDNKPDCVKELDRIAVDMAKSYPNASDYILSCEKRKKIVSDERVF